jgi:2-keto-4-pentenoate hydratase
LSDRVEHDEAQRIAEAFVAARREARPLPAYPGALPTSLAEAYRVQDRALALTAEPVGGWKVGRIMPPLSDAVGSDRLAGPIFAGSIFHTSEAPAAMPVFAGGFGAAEAEFLLRVGEAPPAGKATFSLDEAAALIEAVHLGIEIASSPLAAINDLGPAVTISDFGNNNGLVIGAPITDWRSSGFADWPVSLRIDGVEAGSGRAAAMPDGPLGAARFLLERLGRRGIAVVPGQWISSGAVTGVHPVAPGALVEAVFDGTHKVSCTIEAATRRELGDDAWTEHRLRP